MNHYLVKKKKKQNKKGCVHIKHTREHTRVYYEVYTHIYFWTTQTQVGYIENQIKLNKIKI